MTELFLVIFAFGISLITFFSSNILIIISIKTIINAISLLGHSALKLTCSFFLELFVGQY